MTNVLGLEMNYVTAILALGIVIVLIVLAVWLIKLLGEASRTVGRGRQKRLAIIDSIPIDQKRQAILIRRDDVEYLLVTGGPNDVVVEGGIPAPPLSAPRGARRMPDQPAQSQPAPVEPPLETPAPPRAQAARLRALNGHGKPKGPSLRHTGLLRTGADRDQLVGGNPENRRTHGPDSATSTYARHDENGQGEAAPDAGETEYADEGKSR